MEQEKEKINNHTLFVSILLIGVFIGGFAYGCYVSDNHDVINILGNEICQLNEREFINIGMNEKMVSVHCNHMETAIFLER